MIKQTDANDDPCTTNKCECTVATQDADCGMHQVCDAVSGPGRVCTCAPAYKMSGGACVFDAAPLDKGFQDPTKWTAVGPGATVNIAAAGNLDPGEGVINRLGMCGYGGFKQTFTMPPRSKADQFKVAVTFAGNAAQMQFDLFGSQVSVGVNGQFNDSPIQGVNVYRTDTFCLGPKAYGTGAGSPVDFVVGTFGGPNCQSTSTSTISIDQLALQVAAPGECPDINTVTNGDFEAANGVGWTFNILQAATAAIMPGIGDANSLGLRMATANRCSEATATSTIALPSAADNATQAIEVSFTGTPGDRLTFQLGGKNIAILGGTGANKKQHICVPDWATGTTTSVGFFLQRNSDNACTTALARTFTIDNVKIVSDSACSAGVLNDPGFERVANATGPVPGWGLTNGFVNDIEATRSLILNAPGAAHTGNGVLRLGAINPCTNFSNGGADIAFIVPPAQGTAGPAVKFFANVGANNPNTTTRVAVFPLSFNGPGSIDLPETGMYQEQHLCLPPGLVGRRVNVHFQTADTDGGGCINSNYPEEIAFIDDVSVTTDGTCPAQ